MTSGQMRFLPAVEMTDVSREKRGGCGGGGFAAAAATSPMPSMAWSHFDRREKSRHYELFDFFMVVSE